MVQLVIGLVSGYRNKENKPGHPSIYEIVSHFMDRHITGGITIQVLMGGQRTALYPIPAIFSLMSSKQMRCKD